MKLNIHCNIIVVFSQTGLGVISGLKTPERFTLNWFGLDKAKAIEPKPNRCRFVGATPTGDKESDGERIPSRIVTVLIDVASSLKSTVFLLI